MDINCSTRATSFARHLAKRYNLDVTITTATFTGGGEGYSVTLTDPQPGHYSGQIATFYNDDQFGPRWIGKCGVHVPGHKLPAYVAMAAENPDLHPSNTNAILAK